MERLKGEVLGALSSSVLDFFNQPWLEDRLVLSSVQVAFVPGHWEDDEGKLLTFATQSLGRFKEIKGKALCVGVPEIQNIRALKDERPHE